MAKREFAIGATSQSVDVAFLNSSTGAGLTGIAYNTSGLKVYYRKQPTGAFTQITLASQTHNGAWTSGGFAELDSTNAPGWYRLDLPDACFSTECMVSLTMSGATNMSPCWAEFQVGGSPIRSGVTKNQAIANFPFNMVSSADGVSAATGKTVTAQRSIDGGAWASCTNTGTIAEVGSGGYTINLSASDVNGTTIHLKFTASGCIDRFITIVTTP